MIISKGDRIDDMVPEGGIATGVLVFVLRHKQALTAACAGIHTSILDPPVLSSEWSFIANALSDIELHGAELGLELFSSLSKVLGDPALMRGLILELAGAAILSLKNQVSHTAVDGIN